MILQRLKTETQPYHDRLERRLDLFKTCDTVQHYQSLLQRFYGLYSPLEDRLASRHDWPSVGIDFESRRKSALILLDLQTLDPAFDSHSHSHSHCTALPDLSQISQAFGCLYVMEGATLGGQLIARYLAEYLCIQRENGARFFDPYESDVGRMWKSFREAISAFSLTSPETDDAIVQSACDTFQTFERWLC